MKDKKFLLNLARRAIEAELKGEKLGVGEVPEGLKEKRACFVTLTIGGKLRGCIGTLEAEEPLYRAVASNAIKAGFEDPRFRPLTEGELKQVEIEISILESPKVLKSESFKDMVEFLDKNRPGVIIKKGYNQATFLPQVWEELPGVEEFMGQLCRKAGLEQSEWKRGNLEVWTYGVEVVK